ncbi:hypothetical protein [Stenotrophomonas maltophilia]|jgi:hypothetical protein|nr:hypothetical protein [Stenotrophomonas maltophilia]QGL81744.1 hypothetical protein FEO94_17755 [Stenotrophomonas maltophilia]
MPTIPSSIVPPPKSWEEFEDISLSAAKLRWNSTDFFRNGRQGQSQDGVDIWGHDDHDRYIGVQCKNTVAGITLAVVESEIDKAESFAPTLDRLYIATTAPRDATLQRSVREMSQSRGREGKFKVDVLFWDDLCQDLAKDESVFFSYYPQFRADADPADRHDKALWKEITTLLHSDGVIGFLDQTNMAGSSFELARLIPLWDFQHKGRFPEWEFISPELDTLRKDLWNEVDGYLNLLAFQTFPTRTPGWNSVPAEWEIEKPERFWRTVEGLHARAEKIVSLHASFVRAGRSKGYSR